MLLPVIHAGEPWEPARDDISRIPPRPRRSIPRTGFGLPITRPARCSTASR